jgi:protein-S-isoprenylcysteine O-methyltransferase Ste14
MKMRYAPGIAVASLSSLIALASALKMHSKRTPVTFIKATTTIISDGPYGYSRNPLYLSLLLLMLGLSILLNWLWLHLSVIPLFIILDVNVIRREERYLENEFGDSYREYKGRVRK